MNNINMLNCVCFYSGGKDSCFNMMCCIAEGHDIVALINLKPDRKGIFVWQLCIVLSYVMSINVLGRNLFASDIF